MSTVPTFPEGQIESLSRLLGECGTGDQITRALDDRGLDDHSGQSTKWRRLHWVFSDSQRQHGCANRIIDFIQSNLKTDTEKSEHKGFAQLLKGCFAAVRNPLAHEPEILWEGEEDAADYFTLISLLHRRLDRCVRVSFPRH